VAKAKRRRPSAQRGSVTITNAEREYQVDAIVKRGLRLGSRAAAEREQRDSAKAARSTTRAKSTRGGKRSR
jgi:hypothetical protein